MTCRSSEPIGIASTVPSVVPNLRNRIRFHPLEQTEFPNWGFVLFGPGCRPHLVRVRCIAAIDHFVSCERVSETYFSQWAAWSQARMKHAFGSGFCVKRVGHRNQVLGQRNGSGMSIESSMPEPMGWDCQAGWCSPDVSGGNPELLQ